MGKVITAGETRSGSREAIILPTIPPASLVAPVVN
jgi:hypothetical protein